MRMLLGVEDLLRLLAHRKLTLAIAEGDTGGLLLERCTAIPGSSAVVLGGVVAYADGLKVGLLPVPESVLREQWAGSAGAAEGMAVGVRQLSGAGVGRPRSGSAGRGG